MDSASFQTYLKAAKELAERAPVVGEQFGVYPGEDRAVVYQCEHRPDRFYVKLGVGNTIPSNGIPLKTLASNPIYRGPGLRCYFDVKPSSSFKKVEVVKVCAKSLIVRVVD